MDEQDKVRDEVAYKEGYEAGLSLTYATSWQLTNDDYWEGYEAGLTKRQEIDNEPAN